MIRKVLDLASEIRSAVSKLRVPWLFPRIYLKILILGLILVGLNYSYIPNLTYCSGLFGGDFCSPIGIYLIAFASLPGYLAINAIFPNIFAGNDSFYSLIVFLSAFLIYLMTNYFLVKAKNIKFYPKGLIYVIFAVFLFALLVLIPLVR